MAEKRRLTLLAGILLLVCLAYISYGDDCQDQCTAPCDALKCQMLSPVFGGCWFDGANCWSCTGSKAVTACEQYGSEEACQANACSISSTCQWIMDACLSTGISQSNCKTKGCAFSYKCMADGECVHFSVSTQDYCRNVYTEHGFSYNLADPASCDKVDSVCKKTDEKCQELSEASADLERQNECALLRQMCLQCQGDCELRRSVNSIENIIYGTAAGLAVLLLAINAIQIMTAEDALARSNAKKGIAYVALSLLIILIAVKFIEYVWISFTT